MRSYSYNNDMEFLEWYMVMYHKYKEERNGRKEKNNARHDR